MVALLFFIHHIAKTRIAEMKKVGRMFLVKGDSQGAGAITQKPRTILALSNDPASNSPDGLDFTNYLHIVKLNQMGRYYQQNAIELRFSGTNLTQQQRGIINIEAQQKQKEEGIVAAHTDANKQFVAKKRMPHETPEAEFKATIMQIFGISNDIGRDDLISKLCAAFLVGRQKVEQRMPYVGFLPYALDKGWIIKTFNGRYELGVDLRGPEVDTPF